MVTVSSNSVCSEPVTVFRDCRGTLHPWSGLAWPAGVLLMKNFTQSSGRTVYPQGMFQETTGGWVLYFNTRYSLVLAKCNFGKLYHWHQKFSWSCSAHSSLIYRKMGVRSKSPSLRKRKVNRATMTEGSVLSGSTSWRWRAGCPALNLSVRPSQPFFGRAEHRAEGRNKAAQKGLRAPINMNYRMSLNSVEEQEAFLRRIPQMLFAWQCF